MIRLPALLCWAHGVRVKTLVVGIGALGGVVAARMLDAGADVHLATRDSTSARILKAQGLTVAGIGGDVSARVDHAAAVAEYTSDDPFDLIVLATKAHDAIVVAPALVLLLAQGGTLLPIQNGGVAQLLAERLGTCVLGGLSNLGATMTGPGRYEQRNAGHLLIGELSGGNAARAEIVRRWLGQGVDVKTTSNMTGAIWSKLLLNCSVTTIGAIAGRTMREYIGLPAGRALFERAYDEALSVALATKTRPQRMLVEPIPPGWAGVSVASEAHTNWLREILNAYGDLKPSMLQDFERGRITEIEFINGYVSQLGRRLGIATPANDAIVRVVQAITKRKLQPDPNLLSVVMSELQPLPR